jgi:hypothetical protein
MVAVQRAKPDKHVHVIRSVPEAEESRLACP